MEQVMETWIRAGSGEQNRAGVLVSCWRQEDCTGHGRGLFVGRGGRRRGQHDKQTSCPSS